MISIGERIKHLLKLKPTDCERMTAPGALVKKPKLNCNGRRISGATEAKFVSLAKTDFATKLVYGKLGTSHPPS